MVTTRSTRGGMRPRGPPRKTTSAPSAASAASTSRTVSSWASCEERRRATAGFVTTEQAREQRIVLLDHELPVRRPLLHDRDLHDRTSASLRKASSVFSSRSAPRRQAASASSSGIAITWAPASTAEPSPAGSVRVVGSTATWKKWCSSPMKPGAGKSRGPEPSERVLGHREAELLGELTRGRRARALARLDETGRKLPEHSRRRRLVVPQADRRTKAAAKPDPDASVGHVMRRHDRGVERAPVDHVVRKRRRARAILHGDELHAPELEEAALADPRLADDLELDLGGVGQASRAERSQVSHPRAARGSRE